MDIQTFGLFIKNCRKDLGMTQGELAAKLNVTDKAISRWERGVGLPDIKLLEPLAEALQISIQELMQCKRMKSDQSTAEITDESEISPKEPRKELWLGKYRRVLAVIVFCVYSLFYAISRLPVLANQLNWLSPLVGILFSITIGAFLYASYREESHGIY